MCRVLACKHTHNTVTPPPIINIVTCSNPSRSFFSAVGSVSDKQKKRRQSNSSEVDSCDVQSGSQHSRTKTGPIRNGLSISGRSRKPITELTLADHDASQTTLEDYYSVQHSQTTPVSTYPPYKMTPNRRKRIRRCLFPPGE